MADAKYLSYSYAPTPLLCLLVQGQAPISINASGHTLSVSPIFINLVQRSAYNLFVSTLKYLYDIFVSTLFIRFLMRPEHF